MVLLNALFLDYYVNLYFRKCYMNCTLDWHDMVRKTRVIVQVRVAMCRAEVVSEFDYLPSCYYHLFTKFLFSRHL